MPIVILMGVSGSGKTTVGRAIARKLQWDFYDADDYHSPINIAKISGNEPLTDSDRIPWLESLRQLVNSYVTDERSMILACSALKRRYRHHLIGKCPKAQLVYLQGTPELIRERLKRRQHHFATVDLLDSQFADLEEPREGNEHALTIDISRAQADIVSDIVHYLTQNSPTGCFALNTAQMDSI
ncbi:MAG: gluconokinase [Synechococcus sp.]